MSYSPIYVVAIAKYENGLKVFDDTGTFVDSNNNVDRENTQSKMSCPKDVNSLSAIYQTDGQPAPLSRLITLNMSLHTSSALKIT